MAKLTAKQEMFVREYLVDLNATQAAIRAGYSKKNADKIGSQLLGKTGVASRVSELKAKRAGELEIDANWVLRRLIQINDQCLQPVPVEKWDPVEKKMVQTGEFMFDSQGANRSAELIGKHLGMFDKLKIEHSGSLGVTIVDDVK